jgi:Family of unknown function (DUF6130)
MKTKSCAPRSLGSPEENADVHLTGSPTLTCLAAMVACTVFTAGASGQCARGICGPSPLVAIANEAPAKLTVDPPLPKPLALGRVFIQYRTENLGVVPVFGKGAVDVSPRVGRLHITVDDASWHFVDATGETVVLVGLKSGPHRVLFELADPR